MHRDVGATVEHRLLDLFHEHALAAHLVDRHVLAPIAGGLDHEQLHHLVEERGDEVGLEPGQRAPASRGPQRHA